jgi:hypothetical protein
VPTAGISHEEIRMNRIETHPDFTRIEQHIRDAHLQRTAYLGHLIADGGIALARALKRLGAVMGRAYDVELDQRAIEADAFLRRSIHP